MKAPNRMTRRAALRLLGAGGVALALGPSAAFAGARREIFKSIPSSGAKLPVIGMGTWRTFNVGSDTVLRNECVDVMRAFFDEGGGMIDSSPMYGSAQEVLGYGFERMGVPDTLFSADKVWTNDGGATREQVEETEALWGIERFDLLQVHNLLAWDPHLETLQAMKEAGEVGYVGITTSHGRRHDEFERVMQRGGIDFVQLTYNITHTEVEQRLLPLAADRGIAVIANRPFEGGSLIRDLKRRHKLPEWATDAGFRGWPDFLLKWIVSHPSLTCAIPATSRVEHMRENMAGGRGELPDAAMRERMARYVRSL